MSSTAFRIAAIEAFHLVAPDRAYWGGLNPESRATSERYLLKPGWRAAYGKGFETAIVKVTLDDGTVGWGEATEPICPEVICRLVVHLVAPFIGGRSFEHPETAWSDAYDLQRVRGHTAGYFLHALAAIDIALWDAIARREDTSMARILAADPANSIPVYLSGLRRESLNERSELLAKLVCQGLSAVKLFVTSDTAATLAEIDALQTRVGGDWDLMVDALWSFGSVNEAAQALRQLSERHVRWLECPLIPEDLGAHQQLVSMHQRTQIALGEHFFTHYQSAPWLDAGALEIFQPDIGRTGFSSGLRQTGLAQKRHIAVTPHMGSGSPIIQAAALSFWAAIRPQWPCEYQFDLADVLPETFKTAWTYSQGQIAVPEEAGLAVAVDEASLRSNTRTIECWRSP